MKFEYADAEALAKRMLYLAWQASKVVGMGILQDKPAATEADVWQWSRDGRVDGDYVFGRMMKISFDYGADFVEFKEGPQRPDYQSWSTTYPTYKDLAEAAVESLKAGDPEPTTKGSDHMHAAAIMQGVVPVTCNLPGELIAVLHISGEDPCAGCNSDRSVCKGRPKSGRYVQERGGG